MVELIETDDFRRWRRRLRDQEAVFRINTRLARLSAGLSGDVKPLGEGLSELRIDYGPGYRVYFIRRGGQIIILLAGGDKRTQLADIKRARSIAQAWQR